MGPNKRTERYEEQAEQVRAFLRNTDAKTTEDEDQVLLLFILDTTYSREAIMDGLGRYRIEKRAA